MISNQFSSIIIEQKEVADAYVSKQKYFDLQWNPDFSKCDSFLFKGYTSTYEKSDVTGNPVLCYHSSKAYEKNIPFYKYYQSVLKTESPKYFVIGQEWSKVIEQLQSAGVVMRRIKTDVECSVTLRYFKKVEFSKSPYEGHFLHKQVSTDTIHRTVTFHRGDYVVELNQPLNGYIMHVLTPEAPDSYFRWNFFDAVLQQKEWFSDYVFDKTAKDLLKSNPSLKLKFDAYVAENKLEQNPWEQLLFIYRNSDYYESSHLRYPVYSVNNEFIGIFE